MIALFAHIIILSHYTQGLPTKPDTGQNKFTEQNIKTKTRTAKRLSM